MRQSRGSAELVRVLIVAALATLVALGLRAAQWVAARPQPQAIADWLTVARFSLFDVFTGIWVVFMLGVIVWAAAYGRRL
jgi:hypothetical protein